MKIETKYDIGEAVYFKPNFKNFKIGIVRDILLCDIDGVITAIYGIEDNLGRLWERQERWIAKINEQNKSL